MLEALLQPEPTVILIDYVSSKSIKPLVNVEQRFIISLKKYVCRRKFKGPRRQVNKTISSISGSVLPLESNDVIVFICVPGIGQVLSRVE